MAEVESISHSGMVAPDSRAVHDWYEEVLGGKWMETVSRNYEGTRGANAHSCGIVADYLYVTFPRPRDVDPPDVLRGGDDSFRHAYSVSQERFEAAMQWLLDHDVPFEGPVTHPERGPIGQSIYFRDNGGNYLEICWRRDQGKKFNPVIMASV
jgi:Glyoxalase/Bleomycin resistance protein/Dioxygenase superfamily